MNEDIICKATLSVGQYEIKVKVIQDHCCELLHTTDMAEEVCSNSLPESIRYTFVQGYSDFAVSNDDHAVYIMSSSRFGHDRYFILRETLAETRGHIMSYAYSKNEAITPHEAWLEAIKYAKQDYEYISQFFSDLWNFVGISASVQQTMTDETGLIWSREINCDWDSIWGVEWSNGYGTVINNEEQFKHHLPDLLPDEIELSDEQINRLWLDLD